MPNFQMTSALSALHKEAGFAQWQRDQLCLQELTDRALVRLQGPGEDMAFRQRVTELLGVTLPEKACHASSTETIDCLWMNPNEWMLWSTLEEEDQILERLAPLMDEFVALVTRNSDSRVGINVCGEAVTDLLSKGCTLDLHRSAFTVGQCTVTRFAEVPVILHRLTEESFDLYVDRSLAHYLWDWLVDAGSEFDCTV